jgi:hypothetical protein
MKAFDLLVGLGRITGTDEAATPPPELAEESATSEALLVVLDPAPLRPGRPGFVAW